MDKNLQTKKKKGCFKIGLIVIAVFFALQLIIGGLMYIFESDESKAKRAEQKKIELLEEKKEERRKELSGYVFRAKKNAVELLKNSLKDPKSYDEINKKGGYSSDSLIIVEITYRATNSFGAYLQDKKKFIFSKDGDRLIEVK